MTTAPLLLEIAGRHALALALAVAGAALFGLAAVRQHGAVQLSLAGDLDGRPGGARAFWRLVRRPAWLLGSLQGIVAGGLHVAALALAPIALVQPVGVLAVPVTVALRARSGHHRPTRRQLTGCILSVASIVVLTLLLVGAAHGAVHPHLPAAGALAAVVLAVLAGAVLTSVLAPRLPRPLSGPTLACAAAVLFGLTSVLLRIVGATLLDGRVGSAPGLWVVALVGALMSACVGTWLMQTAYGSGAPQVAVCCLTLVDPLTAVGGGGLLLHEGLHLTALSGTATVVCALLAAAGVVLLSGKQSEPVVPAAPPLALTSPLP